MSENLCTFQLCCGSEAVLKMSIPFSKTPNMLYSFHPNIQAPHYTYMCVFIWTKHVQMWFSTWDMYNIYCLDHHYQMKLLALWKKSFNTSLSFYVNKNFASMYHNTTCMPGACRGQKRVLDSWAWSFRWLWAATWVLGTWLSGKAARTLNCWANAPTLRNNFSN